MDHTTRQTRREALRSLIVLPALAGALALSAAGAEAASNNQAQFKYQTHPNKNGQKCSQCALFKPPSSCKLVTGTISPNGWCVAFSAKK
jgi:hypothetical protein